MGLQSIFVIINQGLASPTLRSLGGPSQALPAYDCSGRGQWPRFLPPARPQLTFPALMWKGCTIAVLGDGRENRRAVVPAYSRSLAPSCYSRGSTNTWWPICYWPSYLFRSSHQVRAYTEEIRLLSSTSPFHAPSVKGCSHGQALATSQGFCSPTRRGCSSPTLQRILSRQDDTVRFDSTLGVVIPEPCLIYLCLIYLH